MRSALMIMMFLGVTKALAINQPPYSFILSTIRNLGPHHQDTCPPMVPDRPLRPTKDFLKNEVLPIEIIKASEAVVSLCFCENREDFCGTFTSVCGGKFLTNEHVIEALLAEKEALEKRTGIKCDWILAEPNFKARKITLSVERRGWWNHGRGVNGLDHTKDLARVYVPELKNMACLRLAKDPIQKGDQVYGAGIPLRNRYISFDRKGMKPAISDGVVTSVNPVNNSADFIGVNGMSGGPVLNSKGELVGIFWGKETNKRDSSVYYRNPDGSGGLPKQMEQETSYFVPVDPIKKVTSSTVADFANRIFGQDVPKGTP